MLGDHLTVAEREGDHSTDPHIHRAHSDGFYVLEGEFAFAIATLFDRARFLNLHAPGLRFDEYLRRAYAGEHGPRFLESFDIYEAEVR